MPHSPGARRCASANQASTRPTSNGSAWAATGRTATRAMSRQRAWRSARGSTGFLPILSRLSPQWCGSRVVDGDSSNAKVLHPCCQAQKCHWVSRMCHGAACPRAPEKARSRPYETTKGPGRTGALRRVCHGLLQQRLRDGVELHVARALVDRPDLGVAIELLRRVLARIAVAAEEFAPLRTHPGGHLPAQEPGHG